MQIFTTESKMFTVVVANNVERCYSLIAGVNVLKLADDLTVYYQTYTSYINI